MTNKKIIFQVKGFLEIENLIFHSCLSAKVRTASNSVVHNSMISLILQLVKLIIGFSFNNLKFLIYRFFSMKKMVLFLSRKS